MNDMPPPEPVRLIWRGKETQHPPGQTLSSLLSQLEIAPESVLAICGGESLDEQAILQAGDVIRIVYVISGGMK